MNREYYVFTKRRFVITSVSKLEFPAAVEAAESTAAATDVVIVSFAGRL